MGTVLVVGAGGMLGQAFMRLGISGAIGIGRDALAPHLLASLQRVLDEVSPVAVVNCAAHTDVEVAEDVPSIAYASNATLPAALASECGRRGIRLVHFSSTGCYGDWKGSPYIDYDPTLPKTVHHRSKLAGEIAVRDTCPDHLILRTGWLYGGGPEGPKNFVWKRILEAKDRGVMQSDGGQFGNPTFVDDVVRQAQHLLKVGIRGTFNCVAVGAVSRAEYVKAIVREARLTCMVEALPAGAFKRRAPVSFNEMAINQALESLGLAIMPDWERSLSRYVGELLPNRQ